MHEPPVPGMIEKWSRYFHTLKYLKPIQISGRLAAQARHRFGWIAPVEVPEALTRHRLPPGILPCHDAWNDRDSLLKRRFCFLNQAIEFGERIDWEAVSMPLLWRFNLHYFNYLYLLDAEEQLRLCRDWIARNLFGTSVAWHPYPLSLRITNWCKAGVDAPDILESLYLQAAYLFRTIEFHITGNHVIENARALLTAGAYLGKAGEAAQWFDRGLELLLQESAEQILADGGHYERSPMYHALMLEAYLDALHLMPITHPERRHLLNIVDRMGQFLEALTHPDGKLALFNDATEEIALPVQELAAGVQARTASRSAGRGAFEESGYFVHRNPDVYLAIDGGPVGPDHLPAHAHADIFSYELSLKGKRVVVDSGVYEYRQGDMRDYVRSTRAHNTVCIDGQDQVECWGAFRVARRWAPHDVTFEVDEKVCRFEGSFGGYARRIGDGISHTRRILADPDKKTITVWDRITGKGRHRVESYIHFHPDVHIEETDRRVKLSIDGVTCSLDIDAAAYRWEEGMYCPAFGVRFSNKVLVLGGPSPLPVELAYTFRY